MTKVCDRHAERPAFIYSQCVGCEIERMRKEIAELKHERNVLQEQLERVRAASARNYPESDFSVADWIRGVNKAIDRGSFHEDSSS